MSESLRFHAEGIGAEFAPEGGVLARFEVQDQGQSIAPLHHAPWGPEDLPAAAPRHQRHLRGDFLAAPFGASSGELHGPSANGDWQIARAEAALIRAVLSEDIMGATVVKELSLSDAHPFVYQRHLFIGGQGRLPLANHAMVALQGGAKLSFSRKRWFETPAAALESDPSRGRSALAYPRRAEDASEFPAADGGSVNLHNLPWGAAHEDFVSAVEEPTSPLGWTAVVRPARKDLFLSLRNPKQLPMTMLWHSNGGRDYAPWSGRHRDCLGIEEGAALPLLGLSAKDEPDPLTAAGQEALVTLRPQGVVDIRHAIGALAWPSGQMVAGVMLEDDCLVITGDWGAERRVPFRGDWFKTDASLPPKAAPSAKIDWDF